MADSLPYVSFGARNLFLTNPQLQGTDVQALQVIYDEMLHVMHPAQGPLGEPLTIDGIFGPKTRQAVLGVQSYFGLGTDGIVGPNTFLAFGQAVRGNVTYDGPALGSRTLSQGDSGGDVMVLQNRLNCFRYAAALGGPADGAFGPATAAAVTQFQNDMRSYGQSITDEHNVAGPQTLRLLWLYTYTGGRTLREGAAGFDVAWLQYYLANTSNPGTGQPFYSGRVDGQFGPVTRGAVEAFQSAGDIAADGVAGPATYRAIGVHNTQVAPEPAPVPATS